MISNQRILPNIEDVGGFVGDLRTQKPQCRNHSSIFFKCWDQIEQVIESMTFDNQGRDTSKPV